MAMDAAVPGATVMAWVLAATGAVVTGDVVNDTCTPDSDTGSADTMFSLKPGGRMWFHQAHLGSRKETNQTLH